MILIYQFTISEVIELVRTRDRIEDLTEGLFLTLTFVALCVKYGNFLARRDRVSMLLDCFRCETCRPKTFEERMILYRYDIRGIETTRETIDDSVLETRMPQISSCWSSVGLMLLFFVCFVLLFCIIVYFAR